MPFPLGQITLMALTVAVPPPPAVTPSVVDPARGGPVLLPCGVADAAGRTGYLSNPTGGIDAVDLVTGDLLWKTDEAQRPLLVVGDRLYAQAGLKRNRIRVLAFDVGKKGECVLESDAVVLPPWVVVGEAPGRSFTARWRPDKDQLLLFWEAHAWPVGPKKTPADLEERKDARGAVRIDLHTGKVTELTETPPAPPTPPRELEKLTVRWQGVVGKAFKALVLDSDGVKQRLVLRSWSLVDGAAGPEKELLTGKRLIALATVDDRFLCIRDAFPSPDAEPGEARLRFGWTLFAVDSGERIDRAPHEPGTQAVALLGPRIYYLVSGPVHGPIDRPFVHPRTLKAIDLKSGKALWERPVEGKTVTPPQP
jgi:hypothetical protein